MEPCDVLVLEDEPMTREHLVALLREGGMTVASADSVPVALDVLTASGARVLVADLRLAPDARGGGQDGHRLAIAAEQLDPTIGVIFISGDIEALRGRELGPRERVLAKPFGREALIDAVRGLLPQ
jgi:CheY-like chemotaxis protein